MCIGTTLNISQYEALYSLIGVIYGGDGRTTFKLPDMRGRIPIGQGTNTTTNPPLTARTIGNTGGEEVHVLVTAEMPSHTHAVNVLATAATELIPGPTTLYAQVTPTSTNTIYGLYNDTLPPVTTPVSFDAKAITYAGSNQAHSNVMRTTVISFIMALLGQYPTKPN